MAKRKKKPLPSPLKEDEISIMSGDFKILADAIEHYTQVKDREFKEWVNISSEVDQIVAHLKAEYNSDHLRQLIEEEPDAAKKLLMIIGFTVAASYGR